MLRPQPRSTLFPYTTLFRSLYNPSYDKDRFENTALTINGRIGALNFVYSGAYLVRHSEQIRSEEHTSELQSLRHLVCRLLLEKKKNDRRNSHSAGRLYIIDT